MNEGHADFHAMEELEKTDLGKFLTKLQDEEAISPDCKTLSIELYKIHNMTSTMTFQRKRKLKLGHC